MPKHIIKISIILFITLILNVNYLIAQSTSLNKTFKVVIDPGHGGDKPGAIGRKSQEKDVALAVGIKVGELIKEYLKDVEVIFTRNSDKDVDLIKRSQLANKEKADIFVSIHCNASKNYDATGTETFVMGLAKTQANIEAAKKENADILTEANYAENYDGFDPNSPETNIFFSLYQNAYLTQSLSLAKIIQEEYSSNTHLHNRGVKQAPYLVLYKTSVPAVLTEIGFISNTKEENYLNSDKGQYEIASSIFRAVGQYKMKMDNKKVELPSLKEILKDKKINEKTISQKDKPIVEKMEEIPQKEERKLQKENENKEELIYRVQFLTDTILYDNNYKAFSSLDSIWQYKDNSLWKYTSGKFYDFESANQYKQVVRNTYKDAFVVSFLDDERIDLKKAREIEIKQKEKNNK
ncbi:MAG: N-acetylmuramoyl-L-alanine amidase [Bacteroidales bacterium]|jgi:N-acetylmuramoyl-L-alanine amidase|nr:N-acetylmuramoyl-L-alanine amidase [Bacteroidales bacterium]